LSLSEWIVLSLISEGLTHGSVVTQQLSRYGEVGHIWNVQKAVVYRALNRLIYLGLIRPAGEEPNEKGPVRLLVEATDEGRAATEGWRQRPVEHTREIRSELLVKLALLERAGTDTHDLVAAQRALLVPIVEALRYRIVGAAGFDRTLQLWRYETASANLRFLDALMLTSGASAQLSARRARRARRRSSELRRRRYPPGCG
jgi:DNA-binding PadR family transcriptional regulator